MNFKSLPELLYHFKDESTGVAYYEKIRWNGNPICPHCGSEKHIERYLSEFASRYNTRHYDADERFEKFLAESEGRLTYKNLIA